MKKIKIGESYLELVIGDITKQKTDAIVNAANKRLASGGGVAGAIHRAAGQELWEECRKLGGCETGKAKITKGYNLPTPHVIHTVGPIYSGSSEDPEKLASCYRESLRLAKENKIRSIAFPALSTGYFGYPIEKAAKIALETILDELKKRLTIDLVRIVLYDSKIMEMHEKVLDSIKY
jgi:O-acetyl-ADP-ribose deacetylase (regulator of RNase III)